jgi:hypothetical protein
MLALQRLPEFGEFAAIPLECFLMRLHNTRKVRASHAAQAQPGWRVLKASTSSAGANAAPTEPC